MKKNPNRHEAPCVSYLFPAFYYRMANLKAAISTLKLNCKDFDTIVCTGVSGILFASPLSLFMKKNLVVVRKQRDASHSTNKIEANCYCDEVGKWIFVDDLVDTGKTLTRVRKAIKDWSGEAGEYRGRFLYDGSGFFDKNVE